MLNYIPSESLTDLLTAARTNYFQTGISTLQVSPADVIDIQGPPTSGKTHLVYHLVVQCILPNLPFLRGWDKTAIVFDMDHSFSTSRLYQLLHTCLTRFLDPSSATQSLAQHSLQKLHVFHPNSSSQLAVTLLHLSQYFSAHLSDQQVGMLAIDSINAYYWPDRFTTEQIRLSKPLTHTKQGSKILPPLQQAMAALESFRRTYGPIIVMTNRCLYSKKKYLARNNSCISLTCQITLHQEAVETTDTLDAEKLIIGTIQMSASPLATRRFLLSITADGVFTEQLPSMK